MTFTPHPSTGRDLSAIASATAALIRAGTPGGLAVFLAAKESGRTTHDIAQGLADRRRPRRATTTPAGAWWDR